MKKKKQLWHECQSNQHFPCHIQSWGIGNRTRFFPAEGSYCLYKLLSYTLCPSHILSVFCALSSSGASHYFFWLLSVWSLIWDILVLNCPWAAHIVKDFNAAAIKSIMLTYSWCWSPFTLFRSPTGYISTKCENFISTDDFWFCWLCCHHACLCPKHSFQKTSNKRCQYSKFYLETSLSFEHLDRAISLLKQNSIKLSRP